MCTKYEVCMSKPVAREVCTDDANADDTNTDDDAPWTKHDCIRLFG